MNRFVKKVAIALLAVVIFSALSVVALAGSMFENYSCFTSGGTFTQAGEIQTKDDATPTASFVNESAFAQGYRVRVLGCDMNGGSALNFTTYDNSPVSYVVCNENKTYSIITQIYESKYRYAKLQVCPNGGSGMTSGHWSADSEQTWATPESAG